jgi:hypothetical protein
MNASEKIKDIMRQKQTCNQENRRLTFEEYKSIMQEHIKEIDGELFLMFHELAGGLDERRQKELNQVIKDFSCNELNALTEKIKDCYY